MITSVSIWKDKKCTPETYPGWCPLVINHLMEKGYHDVILEDQVVSECLKGGVYRPKPVAPLSTNTRVRSIGVTRDDGAASSVLQQGGVAGAPPAQAVDATGAGDCFAGNLLARHCAGDDWVTAARYANAAAALSVQGYGAVEPLPRPAAVQALLAGAGFNPPGP